MRGAPFSSLLGCETQNTLTRPQFMPGALFCGGCETLLYAYCLQFIIYVARGVSIVYETPDIEDT